MIKKDMRVRNFSDPHIFFNQLLNALDNAVTY